MNTTELVRFVERAEPHHIPRRKSTPVFYTELAGPARQAILRARQHLLSEQHEDGSWIGIQSGDASLACQFIFLLAYSGDARSLRAQQAAGTILDLQLPAGGWSNHPYDAADVSVSVQAYFALKLSGLDPADERLRRARLAIRELGGADAADHETRRFLALFGQISFDVCAAAAPEWALFSSNYGIRAVVDSMIWSHRPVREISIECGVRELFVNRPATWPGAKSRIEVVTRFFERHGWTPFRRRALDWAEKFLREQLSGKSIKLLDFNELVWCMIALSAVGCSDKSIEMMACHARLEELLHVDEQHGRLSPQLRTTPVSDTLRALRALRASGVVTDHPCVTAAVRFLSRSRRPTLPLDLIDTAGLLRLLSAASLDDTSGAGVLPPSIEIRDYRKNDSHDAARRFSGRVGPLVASLVERLTRDQQPDGSWGSVSATAEVLQALSHSESEKTSPAISRAVAHLCGGQQADGSWRDETGTSSVYATSAAVNALIAAGKRADEDAIAAGINWLMVHQTASGGWCERGGATQTASALSAFVAAGQPMHAAALRAMQLLTAAQDDQGGWLDQGLVPRDAACGRWYRNGLNASALPLMALSQWAVAAAFAQPAAAEKPLFRLVGAASEN
jgi:squalene-hopene/tetraprenyl-beta-curcumene cyclase